MVKKTSKGSGKPIPKVEIKLKMSVEQGEELLKTLHTRFEKNMIRHKGLDWSNVLERLEKNPEKLAVLNAMEHTGGEPDVVGYNQISGEYIFYDCSLESPKGRRSICYDGEGEEDRVKKGVHPAGNAIDLAAAIGIDILNEDQYRNLQKLGEFDTKTQSWIKTPADIRKLGGAIFADRRFAHVFVYHNTAGSFYSSRGFRGSIKV